MTTPHLREKTKAGTKLNIDQTDYVAVSVDYFGMHGLSCQDCALNNLKACNDTSCWGVVWMTPAKFITLRLTK